MKTSASAAVPVTLAAMLVSCVFSLIVILQNPLLNNDAFGYLHAAEIFNSAGLRPVLETYGWYVYSILIALADRVLPGGMVLAAHLLDTAAYALLTYAFIELCAEYRDTRRMRLFAALCILGFPLLNEMRYFLIRDTAFWAFTLLSLLHLMRFSRGGRLFDGMGWCLALICAIAFRLEGLLLLIFAAPSALLAGKVLDREARLRHFRTLAGIAAAGLGVALLLGISLGIDLPGLVGYAYRFYLPLLGDLSTLLASSAASVSAALFAPENFPGTDNTSMGLVIVLFAYSFTVLANFFNALSLPLVVLLIYGYRKGFLRLPIHCRWPLFGYMAGSALALLLFVLIMHFLTQRYTALLSLLLLSLVPLVLDALYERALAANALRRFATILAVFSVYYFVDSLVSFGYSRRYIEEAIAWTRDEMPQGARLHTNSYAIAWGSGRIPEYDTIPTGIIETLGNSRSADYIGIDVKNSERDVKAWLEGNTALQFVTSFSNERGDEVRIYRHR